MLISCTPFRTLSPSTAHTSPYSVQYSRRPLQGTAEDALRHFHDSQLLPITVDARPALVPDEGCESPRIPGAWVCGMALAVSTETRIPPAPTCDGDVQGVDRATRACSSTKALQDDWARKGGPLAAQWRGCEHGLKGGRVALRPLVVGHGILNGRWLALGGGLVVVMGGGYELLRAEQG